MKKKKGKRNGNKNNKMKILENRLAAAASRQNEKTNKTEKEKKTNIP